MAARASIIDPGGATQEMTCSKITYDYLVGSGVPTKGRVAAFFQNNVTLIYSYKVKGF